jgi:predicted nucleic acid-binding protein
MRILLDTNILLRSAKQDHPQYRGSVDAAELLRQRGHELLIVPQVLYEFWAVATRPVENNGLGMHPTDAEKEIVSIQRLMRLCPDEPAIFHIWKGLVASLQVKGKQTHDARLAAAMEQHAITHLLTFNTADFSRYKFVTAVSPVAVMAGNAGV